MGKSDPSEKKAATPAKLKPASKATTTAPSVQTATSKPAAAQAVKAAGLAKPAPAKKPGPAKLPAPAAPSPDDIGLRAYFISEKRQQLGLPGDSDQDWQEAERQLIAEAKATKPLRKKTA